MRLLVAFVIVCAGAASQLSAQFTPDSVLGDIRQLTANSQASATRAAASDWRAMVSLEVQLDGSAGGRAFHTAGRLYMVAGQLPRMEDANLKSDVNAVEVMLFDQQGIFSFSTHTYLLRRAGAMTDMMVDLAQVKLTNNGAVGTIEVTPVKQLTPFAAGRNSFFASNESAGAAYQISEGTLRLELTQQSTEVTGSIQMTGVNVGTGATETITATFTGKPEALGILDPSTSNTIRNLPGGTTGGLKM